MSNGKNKKYEEFIETDLDSPEKDPDFELLTIFFQLQKNSKLDEEKWTGAKKNTSVWQITKRGFFR